MTVLERSELDASPLADLHAIADQLGLDGFRRLRKAELIDAILERSGGDGRGAQEAPESAERQRASRGGRARDLRSRSARAGRQPRRTARSARSAGEAASRGC